MIKIDSPRNKDRPESSHGGSIVHGPFWDILVAPKANPFYNPSAPASPHPVPDGVLPNLINAQVPIFGSCGVSHPDGIKGMRPYHTRSGRPLNIRFPGDLMSDLNVIERLQPIFEKVNHSIIDRLASDVAFVSEVCEYILLSGGKRLRPTLFVLSANLCEFDTGFEYSICPAFEYLHAATLLHDDVIDEGDTRRGKKAAHLVYGNPGVILVGDFLLAKSMALGAETGRLAFTETMSFTVARMAEGEVLQLLHSRDPEITESDYEKVIHRKTGVLIESSCYLGAVIADAEAEKADALRQYGRMIGMAFQITDDTLDYTGTEAEFGKPVGHDLDEGKVTLPLIRTLKDADEADKNELRDLIVKEGRTPEEFDRVKALISKYKGVEQSLEKARSAVEEAKQALDIFPDGDVRRDLKELADYIISRRK